MKVEEISQITGTPVDRLFRFRREFLVRALGLGAAGLALSGRDAEAQAAAVNDGAILNFALNLEYLEAEFYTLGVFGMSIEQFGIGVNGAGTVGSLIVKNNPQVQFVTPAFKAYATEIAGDEQNHVKFLRAALAGAGVQPVARPTIDLLNSFNTAAQLAGISNTGFDPFASEDAFLIGSFVFEDVGVTAYHGAAKLISNKNYLDAAAGILAVEAYHAGEIRTLIYGTGNQTLINDTVAIAALRASASGVADDQGVVDANGNANIVPTDGNSLAFDRTTSQVLAVVYLGGTGGGGFFPNGMNGAIR